MCSPTDPGLELVTLGGLEGGEDVGSATVNIHLLCCINFSTYLLNNLKHFNQS